MVEGSSSSQLRSPARAEDSSPKTATLSSSGFGHSRESGGVPQQNKWTTSRTKLFYTAATQIFEVPVSKKKANIKVVSDLDALRRN